MSDAHGGDGGADEDLGASATVLAERPSDRAPEPLAFAPTLAPGAAEESFEGRAVTREHPGRYRRGDELGSGGMGRVVVAFDEHLGREVAMKELHAAGPSASSGSGATAGVVTRFVREARITGQLEHPNIVPVHELARRADGTLFYTMKRIRGRSLGAVLGECRTLEERLRLLPRFRDVCEALAYAHSRGVIHRDVKPDNVMVGEFGETLVVDWGLAKVRGEDDVRGRDIERRVNLMKDRDASSTLDGQAIGTPAYMSPEQARGDLESIDERSDVWGLGAVLFEILVGRPPYEGDKAVSILHKVLEEPAPRVRDVLADAPPELAAIADRALLSDPSSRYPDARALAAEITAYEQGRQVHAYEYSGLEQLRRFVSRHRAASVAALVGALAVLVAAALASLGYRGEREARRIAQTRRDQAIARQHEAEDAEVAARVQLARALLAHAGRSLLAGDPSAAGIYAAGALLHDPANPDSPEHVDLGLRGEAAREAEARRARALSVYLEAEDARRFVFVRRVPGASARGALSPDGRVLVFPAGRGLAVEPVAGGERRALDVSADRVLGFLDADRVVLDGEEPRVLRLSDGRPLTALASGAVSFARGTETFALARASGEVVVRDAETYAERARFALPYARPRLAALDDGWLAVGSGRVSRWGVDGDGPLAEVSLDTPVFDADVSPAGRVALTIGEPTLALLDGASLEAGAPLEATGPVWDARWLGRSLLVSAEGAAALVLRNVRARHRLDTLHVPGAPRHRVEVSRRGGLVVALPEATGARLSAATVFRFERHRLTRTRQLEASVQDLAIDRAADRVVVASLRGLVALPSTSRGFGETRVLASAPEGFGAPGRVAVGRDGAVALSTDRGAVLLFERGGASPRVVAPPGAGGPCPPPLAWSREGGTLLYGDASGRVRRASRTGTRLLAPLRGLRGPVCELARAPGGDRVAALNAEGQLRVWDPPGGEGRPALERAPGLTALAFDPRGERLAVGDRAGQVRILEGAALTERRRFAAHEGAVQALAWAPDGAHLASSGVEGTVRVASPDGLLERVIRTRGGARGLAYDRREAHLFFGDTAHVVRVEIGARAPSRDPEALLRVAQARAGVHLEGLALVPD